LENAQAIAQELSAQRINHQNLRKTLEAAEEECNKLQGKLEKLEDLLQEKRKALSEIENAIAALAYNHDEHMRLTGLIPQVKRRAGLDAEIAELEKKCAQHDSALRADLAKLEQSESALAEAVETSRDEEENLKEAKDS